MSEVVEQISNPGEKQPKKQRALNVLVFLLTAAVCVQGYFQWELLERLNAAEKQLDSVKQLASSDWKVVPRPGDNAAAPNGAPSLRQPLAQQFDPFSQMGSFWDPFADMNRIRQELDRLMGQMRSNPNTTPQAGGVAHHTGTLPQAPQINLNDTGDAYVLKAYLPGVDESDVKVSVENGRLTLCVKDHRDNQIDRGGIVRQHTIGTMTSQYALPEAVDGANMKKTVENGVITVTIPKAGRASRGTNSAPSESVRDE